jgi:hypothetical protein
MFLNLVVGGFFWKLRGRRVFKVGIYYLGMVIKKGLSDKELFQRAREFEQIGKNYMGRKAFSLAMREFSKAAQDYYALRDFETAAEMYDMAAQSRRNLPQSVETVYKKETTLTAEEYEKMRDSMRQLGKNRRKDSLLEGSMTSASLAIMGIFGGIFFLSSNFLGSNVQLSPGEGMFNWKLWVGAILLVVGLVAGFFWMKSRKSQ